MLQGSAHPMQGRRFHVAIAHICADVVVPAQIKQIAHPLPTVCRSLAWGRPGSDVPAFRCAPRAEPDRRVRLHLGRNLPVPRFLNGRPARRIVIQPLARCSPRLSRAHRSEPDLPQPAAGKRASRKTASRPYLLTPNSTTEPRSAVIACELECDFPRRGESASGSPRSASVYKRKTRKGRQAKMRKSTK